MEPTDLTIQILKEIRDDARKHAAEVNQRFEKMDQRFEKMDQRFEKMDQRFEMQEQRFEAIETALRDMAQQLVMLARGIKTALESRADTDRRIESLEDRVEKLERASS
jgi:chromosome segregation ATPase